MDLNITCGRSRCLHQQRPLRLRKAVQIVAAVKKSSDKNVCCSKTLISRRENVEKVMKLCKDITDFSKEQMNDRKNGILVFDCFRDNWEDTTFHFWERYESSPALGRHNTTQQYQAFMNKVAPLLEKPIGLAMYEYKGGNLGCCSVQAGPKGEGGLDDATGASGAAGGAGLKQTSATVDLTTVKAANDDFVQDAMKDFTTKIGSNLGNVFKSMFAGAGQRK